MVQTTEYTITPTTWRHDYNVSSNNVHCFHVHNSTMSLRKSDLTFHSSANDQGPIVGTCKFRKTSSSSTISLANPSSASRLECELQRKGSWKIQYWFSMQIDGKSRIFKWKRTSSNGRGYKLVEEETSGVFARFLSNGIFSPTKGTLTISQKGEDFELIALMSALTVIERTRRSSSSAAAGAAGGGGGGC